MYFRNVVFTLNNYSDEEVNSLKKLNYNYIVFGFEIGESGTPHLQGYIEFKNSISLSSLKKMIKRAHLERRQGSPLQASDYCKKDGNFWEDGEISNQGKRTDLLRLVEIIEDGNSLKDVAKLEPVSFIKFHGGIQKLILQNIKKRDYIPNIFVYYGKTGTGKSFTARKEFENENYYVWTPARGEWFDAYSGEENVIFEEFRGQLTFGFLLTLLDRYECPIQFKGGSTEFLGKRIIFTSPIHPKFWYTNKTDDSINQLLRRINVIKEFNDPYLPCISTAS